jgi:hypothetical protein
MSPTTLSWPEIAPSDTDTGSDNDPATINNTGNNNALIINITAYDLQGETTDSQYIPAANFTIGVTSEGCSGTAMVNATSIQVGSAILNKGNHSVNDGSTGQEQLFYCLKGLPSDISSQSYSSAGVGSWEIRILLVAVMPAVKRKKKSKKQKSAQKIKEENVFKNFEDNKLVSALDLIIDKLIEEHPLDKEKIIKTLFEKTTKKFNINRKEFLKIIKAREEINIPSTIFEKKLGALESLVKYMKENLNMNYHEIAKELKRNERTIWTAYKNAKEKTKKPIKIKKTEIFLPTSIFENENLTVLESCIIYLKEKEMKFSEIAELLNRDQRNIWSVYSRAIKK